MALVITVQCAQTVEVNANTAETTPPPSMFAVKVVVVIVSANEVPVCTHLNPASSSPALVDTQAIPVSPHLAVTTAPEPSWALVVVVATVQVPVGSHSSPMALVIAVQGAQAIAVHTNAPEPTPSPLSASMQMMVVVIATNQMPVTPDLVPSAAIPTFEDAQTVQMATNAVVPSPIPARSLVIMVSSPEVPVSSHATPVTLIIPVQHLEAISVKPDSTIPTPSPPRSAMQCMIVIKLAVQVPIGPDYMPSTAIPTLQDAQTVQVPTHAAVASPEPSRSLVVVISSVQRPI